MKKLLALIGLFLILFSAKASAQFELTVGNGFKDGYNLGGGARYLFSLPVLPVSFGGEFIWYNGKAEGSTIEDEDGNSIAVGAAARIATFGAYGAYSFNAGLLRIRPHLTVGTARAEGAVLIAIEDASVGASETAFKMMAAPGLDVILPLGPIRLGVDVRYIYIPNFSTVAAHVFIGF
ncbi:MAG: hypothetical protein SFU91_04035 [Chloroherpetonaceae bacterium]|nr:hypothetical protein [Chloroherpetonaceae bacterium]